MFKNTFRRLAAAVLAAAMLAGGSAMATETTTYDVIYSTSNPIPQIAANTRPAIVQITNIAQNWDPVSRLSSEEPVGAGSGCYIREGKNGKGGYLLTNYHVVENGDLFSATWLDGTEMDVSLVGYDDGTDIAILKFEEPAPADAKPIPMGDSDALVIGELAICIGNPGSADEVLFGTVTAGIISGLEREDINANNFSRSISVIQTDAAINTGNSGGALLNAKGELVGIPTLKFMFSSSTVFEGLGFCIPINSVRDFISQIIETGRVSRPRLGITIADIDGPDEPMRKYPPLGVQVYTIEEDGPSADSGLQVGDVITEINGVRLENYQMLLKELDKYEAGDKVELRVYRYYDADGNLTGDYEELLIEIELAL